MDKRQCSVEGVVISPSFWGSKTVLLTGHTGFKGGWTSLWLQSVGARVVGFSRPAPTDPSLFDAARVATGMTSIIGDIQDFSAVRAVIAEHRPDIIIHMAAQPLVRLSYEEPVETFATNVMGTVHLLEAARTAGCVRAFVCVTSDKCYKNQEWLWGYRENEPMGGYDPYSASKGCAELVTSAYRDSFFNPSEIKRHGMGLASGRAGNVIGGGDWAKDRLMTDMIAALVSGTPAIIRNPMAFRPWQHVLEPVRGYLMLAERLWDDAENFSQGWNFGPNEDSIQSVGWIADWLVQHWGRGAEWRLDHGSHPHEAHHLKLDCSKAKALLGWNPAWGLERALEQILSWHDAYDKKHDMRAVCLQQISDYVSDIQTTLNGGKAPLAAS